MELISGFSKLSKNAKMAWLADQCNNEELSRILPTFLHKNQQIQKNFDEFSENTLSNFYLPYGITPNFKLNGEIFAVPMVTEESSVVAASCKAAKFWADKGGFQAKTISKSKAGQVHFTWSGSSQEIKEIFEQNKIGLIKSLDPVLENMKRRGGGVNNLFLKDLSASEPNLYQLFLELDTCDAMGANIINTSLESLAESWKKLVDVNIIMSIVSNYTPNCLVKAWVSCPIENLGPLPKGFSAQEFAEKFYQAVRVAEVDPYRATTHNKGIMNGVDSLIIATGNDFRAVEAAAHTYASKDGQYKSLSSCKLENGQFEFSLELPIAVGTVGGITSLHPLAKASLEILGNPSANDLAQMACALGLAQNFAAIFSLVTTGIQRGHMKMHLKNILIAENATENEMADCSAYFSDKTVSYSAVKDFLKLLRMKH